MFVFTRLVFTVIYLCHTGAYIATVKAPDSIRSVMLLVRTE